MRVAWLASYELSVVGEAPCRADIDENGTVDIHDLLALLSAWATTDDDVSGFTITEVGGTTVNEGGSSDDFTVVLDAQPAALTVVVFDITSQNTAEATVSPATLTFTPANWDTPQPVVVTGVDDLIDDGALASWP